MQIQCPCLVPHRLRCDIRCYLFLASDTIWRPPTHSVSPVNASLPPPCMTMVSHSSTSYSSSHMCAPSWGAAKVVHVRTPTHSGAVSITKCTSASANSTATLERASICAVPPCRYFRHARMCFLHLPMLSILRGYACPPVIPLPNYRFV